MTHSSKSTKKASSDPNKLNPDLSSCLKNDLGESLPSLSGLPPITPESAIATVGTIAAMISAKSSVRANKLARQQNHYLCRAEFEKGNIPVTGLLESARKNYQSPKETRDYLIHHQSLNPQIDQHLKENNLDFWSNPDYLVVREKTFLGSAFSENVLGGPDPWSIQRNGTLTNIGDINLIYQKPFIKSPRPFVKNTISTRQGGRPNSLKQQKKPTASISESYNHFLNENLFKKETLKNEYYQQELFLLSEAPKPKTDFGAKTFSTQNHCNDETIPTQTSCFSNDYGGSQYESRRIHVGVEAPLPKNYVTTAQTPLTETLAFIVLVVFLTFVGAVTLVSTFNRVITGRWIAKKPSESKSIILADLDEKRNPFNFVPSSLTEAQKDQLQAAFLYIVFLQLAASFYGLNNLNNLTNLESSLHNLSTSQKAKKREESIFYSEKDLK